MAHLDFKVTLWRRIHVPDEKVDEVIKILKEGDWNAPYDLLQEDDFYLKPHVCGGFEDAMTIEENDNASTQELYNNDGELIYKNGIVGY